MNDTRKYRRRLYSEPLETRICLAADPVVIPVHANAFGTSYGELGGEWWNWIAKEPLATNPGIGGPCEANQSGKVWFLAGSFGGEISGTCTIPTGKAIFLPVLASVSFPFEEGPGDFPELEDDVRAEANALTDDVTSVNATLDGVEINAWNYRAESPDGGFTFTIPEDSIFTEPGFDAIPGDYSPAVADGYWLLLKPLSRGSHTISFGGEVEIDGEVVFVAQSNFDLEIVGGTKFVGIAIGAVGLQNAVAFSSVGTPGDANLDNQFDQSDILQVLREGRYLTGTRATWSEGDWNGDSVFDQLDIVAALQSSTYLKGPVAPRSPLVEFANAGTKPVREKEQLVDLALLADEAEDVFVR